MTWLYWTLVALWRRNTGRSWRDCIEADWRAAGWVPPPFVPEEGDTPMSARRAVRALQDLWHALARELPRDK
jgi:hypothetical protein